MNSILLAATTAVVVAVVQDRPILPVYGANANHALGSYCMPPERRDCRCHRRFMVVHNILHVASDGHSLASWQ